MARYRIKRKTFNIVGETGGSVMDTTGKVLNNGVVSTGVGLATMGGLGGTLSNLAESAGVPFSGALGHYAAYKIGKEATKGLGRGLSDAGKDWQAQSAAGV